MTGYQSKKAAAQAKLKCQCSMTTKLVGSGCQYCNPEYMDDDDAQPVQEPVCPECKAGVLYECVACSSSNYPPQRTEQEPVAWMYDWFCDGKLITGWIAHSEPEIPKSMALNIRPLYTTPPQRPWVEPTSNEWFEWWRVSPVANETEAEIDFADFLIIALAVAAKLKEDNNG